MKRLTLNLGEALGNETYPLHSTSTAPVIMISTRGIKEGFLFTTTSVIVLGCIQWIQGLKEIKE
jgi:hypothetical protein